MPATSTVTTPPDSRAQCANAVLMVRPAAFGWNPETALSNRFQQHGEDPAQTVHVRAAEEFDGVAAALLGAGVEVHAVAEPPQAPSPDAVFPNNWVSLHHDGTVVLYPMLAPSRRRERRPELLAELQARGGFDVRRLVDLSHHELAGRYLEGTGSVVFDHATRTAYACLSPRTHAAVLDDLCGELGYQPCVFEATDAAGVPVYHTNVVLAVGRQLAIVCAESVPPPRRGELIERLGAGGRVVVPIDRTQMAAFAGNALELATPGGSVLAMSACALRSFDRGALEALEGAVQRIVAPAIPTIERFGGGSVRCMLAEVFLPRAGR